MPRVTITADDVAAVEAHLKTLVPGVEVVPSTDSRRGLVLGAMSAQRTLTGNGWNAEHAAQAVSFALPAIVPEPLGDLARAVPFAGALLRDALAGFDHPTVFTSPAAEANPVSRIATLCHEFGHHLEMGPDVVKRIVWCVAYGLRPEHRVMAAEAPCYACDLAFRYWCSDEDPDALADAIAEGLRAYGANDALVKDARRQLASHVVTLRSGLCVAVRSVIEAVRVLHARGVKGLPPLPPLSMPSPVSQR